VATPLMPAFDVFCLPSRYEGMPYVLLEALAAGLPIVATHVGGVATSVKEGLNGFIVNPREESQLAQALVALATDASLLNRFSEVSASNASRFCAGRMVEETLAVYQHACSHRSSHSTGPIHRIR